MEEIKQGIIKVILKPNSSKNKIKELDSKRNAYRIEIKAPAEDNKSNIQLVKFLSKALKKDVKIIRGFKNREKLLRISLKK